MEKALQLVFSQQVRDVTGDAQLRKVPILRPACVEVSAPLGLLTCYETSAQAKENAEGALSSAALHPSEVATTTLYESNKTSLAPPPAPTKTSICLKVPGSCDEAIPPQNSPSVLTTRVSRRPRFATALTSTGNTNTATLTPIGPAGINSNNNNNGAAAVGAGTTSTAWHVDPTAAATAAKPTTLLKSLAELPEAMLPGLVTYDSATRCSRAVPLLGVSDSSESIDSGVNENAEKKLLLSDSGESKEEKATFFKTKPRLGEFTELIEWLLRCGEAREITMPSAVLENGTEKPSTTFSEDYIAKLCAAATQVLSAEPTLLELEVPSTDTLVVVGDIHGQFQDLYTSVLCQQYDRRRCNPEGADRHFLFMGDYVDRGPHSLEVVLLLLALKVEYPSLVYLTRGNHEEEKTSRVYGFLTETTSSLGATVGAAVWSAVNKVFLDLPLAAIVTTPRFRFLVMHGGLSPALQTTDQIATIDRHAYNTGELSKEAHDIVDGLLWSDPTIGVGCFAASARGCGWSFGPATSNSFCTKNRLNFICRAHQLAMDGYFWTHNDRVVTVFSAPNYCGINDNRGAVMVVSGNANKPSFDQYEYYENAMEYSGGPSSDFPYSSYFC
ncbi:phosphoprotein phosphatase-like protein [Lotmaria passim]